MNYETRLERLEQQLAPPPENYLMTYIHDGDTRPSDWMEVKGQRFDRGADEGVDNFRQRVLEAAGVGDNQQVLVIHFVRREWRPALSQ